MGQGQLESVASPDGGVQQSSKQCSVKMRKLYHYTSIQNIDQIRLTKVVKKSKKHPIGWIRGRSIGDGAAFFTPINPHTHDKTAIAKNNWSSGWREKTEEGKVDAYISALKVLIGVSSYLTPVQPTMLWRTPESYSWTDLAGAGVTLT